MADFEQEFYRIVKIEGDYSDDSADRGGKTKYGITEDMARYWKYTGDMKDLSLELAKQIYKGSYWDVLKLDEINSQLVASIVFNFAVNSGCRTAARLLQRSLNLLNRMERNWKDIKVDGIIGPETIAAVNNLSPEDEKYVLQTFLHMQANIYISITEQDSSQERFIRGWLNRIKKAFEQIYKI